MEGSSKPGIMERSANFFERLHYAIGAVALGGAIVESAVGVALVNPEALAVVGVIELGHGLIINGIKNFIKNRRKKPGLNPAPA